MVSSRILAISVLGISSFGVPLEGRGCPPSPTICAAAECGFDCCRAGVAPVIALPGDLFQPLDVGLLPETRDISTWGQDGNFLDGMHPFTTDLDVEGNLIFVANNTGMQIWQHNGTATFPRLSKVYLGASGGTGARWCGTPELKHPIQWIDVPDGDSNVAAIGAGQCELGLLVFDTTNKSSPVLKYQADGYDLAGVWTTKVGAAEYAVAGGRSQGARVYNLAAARNRPALCRDNSVGSSACGVYLRQLGTMTNTTGVHGVGKYAAISGSRVEVFDLTSASNTPLVSFDPGKPGLNYGVSLATSGGSTYLTALYFPPAGSNLELGLWDVTSCLSTGCASPGPALDTETISGLNLPRYLSTSYRAGKPHIFVGTEFTCTRNEADWLFEVTGSGSGARLTRVPTRIAYWEWYYGASNVNGTFDARPRRAKFLGDHLYRAMWTFFDVHRYLTPAGPVANFTWAAPPVYPEEPVQFTDQSSGLPFSWTWDVGANGSIDAVTKNPLLELPASQQYPAQVPVELEVGNAQGTSVVTKLVTVTDPCPAIGSIAGGVPTAVVCQELTYEALGVTGKPPLDYSWRIIDDTGDTVDSGSGETMVWTASTPGRFRAELTLDGAAQCEPAVLAGAGVQVQELGQLEVGTPLVTNQDGSSVSFSVTSSSASEWSWDFDEDAHPATANWTAWSSHPIDGPNPTYSYQSPNVEGVDGVRTVRARVRNCADPGPLESPALELYVEFGEAPVIGEFRPICFPSNPCVIDTGDVVDFEIEVTGEPTSFAWDWNGDGVFEESSSSLITSRLYCAPASLFQPRMRATAFGHTAEAISPVEIFVFGPDVCPEPLFADGFEGGSTAAWSAVAP